MVRRGEMLDISDVVELLAIDLIGIVPEEPDILVAANRGRPVAFSRDGSLAGQAFHNIARRMQGEDVPFLTLREQGMLGRIFGFMRPGGD
jgi:septum site-determining protein MinD